MWLKPSSIVATVTVAGVFAVSAAAQSPVGDTLPFRKGQWGVEFPLFRDYSITLLRFGSNHHALLVDGAINIDAQKLEPKTGPGESGSSQRFVLRIGRRAYRRITSNTAGFFDIGVSPSWVMVASKDISGTNARFESRTSTASLGPFVTAGANYFVTPRLSLGMSASSSFAYRLIRKREKYQSFNFSTDQELSGRGFSFSAHTAVITGALYF